ncbi:MAG: hypothetical protein M3N52_11820 [Actinomycetota bacterium]|nr:hypothetical protein [Actinomycetota bacterium]
MAITLPAVGADVDNWGHLLNTALAALESRVIGPFRDDWQAATGYDKGELVAHSGATWLAITPVPADVAPSAETSAYWVQLATPGPEGPQGPQGTIAAMTATDQLVWAGDTVLYRSAADVLKTDDSLVVAGNLTVSGTLSVPGWASFTPAWTAATTNPAIGDGTITGRYHQVGKTVHFEIQITMGTTTTYGSGAYSLSLPVAATGRKIMLNGALRTGTSGVTYPLLGEVMPGSPPTATLRQFPTTAGSSLGSVTGTSPAALASGHIIGINGTYEAA